MENSILVEKSFFKRDKEEKKGAGPIERLTGRHCHVNDIIRGIAYGLLYYSRMDF